MGGCHPLHLSVVSGFNVVADRSGERESRRVGERARKRDTMTL